MQIAQGKKHLVVDLTWQYLDESIVGGQIFLSKLYSESPRPQSPVLFSKNEGYSKVLEQTFYVKKRLLEYLQRNNLVCLFIFRFIDNTISSLANMAILLNFLIPIHFLKSILNGSRLPCFWVRTSSCKMLDRCYLLPWDKDSSSLLLALQQK